MIVGFGHVARVGKDTAANALVRDLGFERRGFADALKELALGADPLVQSTSSSVNVNTGAGHLAHVVHGLGWEGAKDVYPEVRTFLQNLGTAARDVFGLDFWVDQVLDNERDRNIVVSDVRYRNEAERIIADGGIVIRIDRPGRTASGHSSETELADWDGWTHKVPNNGNVIELERAVVEFVKGTDQWKAQQDPETEVTQ